ncbi:hypothetical protein BN1723_016361, partial [Verticillium longisporum]
RPEDFKPLSEDDPDDVVFNSAFGVRSIELNRPKKLNSLNASMIRKIVPRLNEWEKSDMVNVILMKGAGEKAFCAGGDVTALAQYNQEGPDGWKKSAAYFELDETKTIGYTDLSLCAQAIAQCSPELLGEDHDYTVYAFDYSEEDTPLTLDTDFLFNETFLQLHLPAYALPQSGRTCCDGFVSFATHATLPDHPQA